MKTLREWAYSYFRHKDLFTRSIKELRTEDSGLILVRKNGNTEHILCTKTLDPASLPSEGKRAYIITEDTKRNLDVLVDSWGVFKSRPDLLVIFVDMHQSTRWLLFPHTHARISDPKKIRRSLKALSDSASP